jgi:hypothetical protein
MNRRKFFLPTAAGALAYAASFVDFGVCRASIGSGRTRTAWRPTAAGI